MTRQNFLAALFSLLAIAAGRPALADDTVITGTLLDADGKPVAGAEVGDNWQFGEETKAYSGVKTAEDGTFTLTLHYFRPPIAVLAMDADRKNGAGAVIAAEDAAKPVSLRLAPMATVKGEIACTDESIDIAGASLQWQFGKARIGNLYSPKSAKWETKLPPGPWGFWTFHMQLASARKDFDVPADGKEIDLGVLKIAPTMLATLEGKPLPDWKVSDARGVEKTVQPSSYKGKWLLVEFWGFW